MTSKPWIRTLMIDGEEKTDTTYRTPIIEYYTEIKGRTFIDLGAADGYDSRAVAFRGAETVLSVEGKDALIKNAIEAQEYFKLPNLKIIQKDVRLIDTFGLARFDVVLCFGLLYHMENPFNVLKRIKNITGDLLLLETHVAPLKMEGLKKKHIHTLRSSFELIELDGIPFEGKIVYHKGDHKTSKGSLEAPWTFWLTIESLFKALIKAGFYIRDYHFEPDKNTPEVIRKWGSILGFGYANTKVFIAASPKDHEFVEVEKSREKVIKEITLTDKSIVDLFKKIVRRYRQKK